MKIRKLLIDLKKVGGGNYLLFSVLLSSAQLSSYYWKIK